MVLLEHLAHGSQVGRALTGSLPRAMRSNAFNCSVEASRLSFGYSIFPRRRK